MDLDKRFSEKIGGDLRDNLQISLKMLKDNPKGAVLEVSEHAEWFVKQILENAGETPPRDYTLFELIYLAGKGSEKNPDYPNSRDIEGLKLYSEVITDCFHSFRRVANKARHESEFSPTRTEAQKALNNFLTIVEWFYCEYEHGPKLSSIYESQ